MAKLESTVGVAPFFSGFIASTLTIGSMLMDLGDPLTTKVVQGAIVLPLVFFAILSVFGFSGKVALPEKGNRRIFYIRTAVSIFMLFLGVGAAVAGSLLMNVSL